MKKLLFTLGILFLLITPVGAFDQVGQIPLKVLRVYNPQTGEHLYTANSLEYYDLIFNLGWNSDISNWLSPVEGESVYRLYNPMIDDHLYTKDTNEVGQLTQSGWNLDDNGEPVFLSGGDHPVYRLYSPVSGRHLLTTDENEYTVLPIAGWKQEGISLYCMSLNTTSVQVNTSINSNLNSSSSQYSNSSSDTDNNQPAVNNPSISGQNSIPQLDSNTSQTTHMTPQSN